MSFSNSRKWFGLAMLMSFLAIASSTAFGQAMGGLIGVLLDEKGEKAVGYTILVQPVGYTNVYKMKTNKKGEFAHIALPTGTNKLTVVDPNGKEVTVLPVRISFGTNTEMTIDLAKLKAEAEAQAKAERERLMRENPEIKKQMEKAAQEEREFGSLKEAFDTGNALYNEHRYEEAAASFEKALTFAKKDNIPIVVARLADAYYRAGQLPKAMEYINKSLETNPNDANLHNMLGDIYARTGKLTEAQAEFQKVAELDPANAARSYFNAGVVLYNAGKMDEAAANFRKTIELDPNYAEAHFQLGNALMGKVDMRPDGTLVPAPGTVEALETYLKLAPDGKNAATAQSMLATLQSQVQTSYKVEKKTKKK